MRAIVHIGQKKTGSTYLQNTLYQSQDFLINQGYKYWITESFYKYARQRENLNTLSHHLDKVRAKGVKHVIFSEENFFVPILDDSIRKFIKILQTQFTEIYVIVYLRKQEDHFTSIYQQSCRGNQGFLIGDAIDNRLSSGAYNYYSILEFWHQVADRLSVRAYGNLFNGSIVEDFKKLIRLEKDLPEVSIPERFKNNSFDAYSTEVLRLLNQYRERSGDSSLESFKKKLRKTIKRAPKQTEKFRLTYEQKMHIHQRVLSNNLKLCDVYGLEGADRAYMISEPKDTGPGLTNDDITKEDIVRFFATLLDTSK